MKKKLLKIILIITIYISVSIGIYFILKSIGLLSVNKIRNLTNKFGVWSYLIYFLIQTTISTFICVIPFEDELLTASAILLFGPIKGFFVCAFNMFTVSSMQFIIGRYFCKGLARKLLGDDFIKKYEASLSIKGEIMLPILYAIPLLPHDSLCILAGMSKMKYLYFAPITLLMRSIEIACICFLGSGLIDFASFGLAEWIFAINLLIIDIYLVFRLQKYVESKIKPK